MTFKDRTACPMLIVQEILRANEEIKVTSTTNARSENTTIPQQWERSKEGVIKVNCDARWCSTSRRGGIEIIVRNHEGSICGGRHYQVTGDSIE